MKMNMNMQVVNATANGAFQGDVGLRRVDALPEGAELTTKNDRLVLAYGEVTGHKHQFNDQAVQVFAAKVGNEIKMFVHLPAPAALYHEEHSPIAFQEGTYEVINQEEYTYEGEFRRVAD